MINVVSENVISFRRISKEICDGYRIIVKENVDGVIKEYVLDEIENPKAPITVKEAVELEYNEELKWQLPDDVVATGSDSISVWLNHVQLTTVQYTLSAKHKLLYLHSQATPDDLIEVEYEVDRITYTHNTSNICEYSVVPIFKRTHSIGRHTVL